MVEWPGLLAHAKDLLRPADADVLLRLEEAERNRKNSQEQAYGAWWPVAATSLRPKTAAFILDAAEKRYPEAPEIPLARWRIGGQKALPEILRWFYRSAKAQQQLTTAIELAEPNAQYEPVVEAILTSREWLRIHGEAMYRMAALARQWKVDFDSRFVNWIFAQPPDPNPSLASPPRRQVLQTSGLARKLVWDSRFLKADSQLLYGIEQCLVGDLKLSKSESVRLDILIRGIDQTKPDSTSESALHELRSLLRQGTDAPDKP
jgi:hypothetical protein